MTSLISCPPIPTKLPALLELGSATPTISAPPVSVVYADSVLISVPVESFALVETTSTSESSVSLITSRVGLPATAPLSIDLGAGPSEPLVAPIVMYMASDQAPPVVAPVHEADPGLTKRRRDNGPDDGSVRSD